MNLSFSFFIMTFSVVRVPLIYCDKVSLDIKRLRKTDYTNPVYLRTILYSNHISYSCLKTTEKSLGAYQSSDHRGPSI